MAQDDDPERVRVEGFVRENWAALAALAWRDFMAQGRGGLLLEWRDIETWEAGRPLTIAPHYVTYTEVSGFGLLIGSYDPEKAIVVAVTGGSEPEASEIEAATGDGAPGLTIIRADASFRVWSFEFEPKPPAAMASRAN